MCQVRPSIGTVDRLSDGCTAEIPKTVVAAASFDDMIAITGYTIFINIAVQGQGNQAWHIARGPLSVLFGVLLGLAATLFCSATVLWNTAYKRTAVLVIVGGGLHDRFGSTASGRARACCAMGARSRVP